MVDGGCVLFLDIDGVLNSTPYLARLQADGLTVDGPEVWVRLLDPIAMARLSRIVEATGADVFITSSWSYVHSVDTIQRCFGKRGFTGQIVGGVSSLGFVGASTNFEVMLPWFEDHPVASFACLDDTGTYAPFTDRLVRPALAEGLLDEHVDRVIELLRTPIGMPEVRRRCAAARPTIPAP